MPYMLRFHDTDDGTELPDPAQVGHAAAWAAERGYWDVATCLMELAHALAELETPTPARDPLALAECAERRCFVRPGVPHSHPADGVTAMGPDHADPRYVDQAAPHPESRLTEALARAKPDVVPPACSDHGQPMLQGLRLEDGTYDWHCVCVLPRRM